MNIAEMPLDPTQRWEWIKYQLRIHGCPPAELARQLDITDRAIRAVKSMPYPRIERAIAKTLGVEPVELWPERWNLDGTPRRQRPNRAESISRSRAKDSVYVPVSHRKTGTEA
ncbi:helix-turn-helix domain-containing protein [Pseudomonas resinovorans]|uniref:Helix-turn-helix domain-containing protein n=1 Tax=Metapseudomonas resinovorans TaxID=53412 RepID=A0ABT4Y4V9_METRE|nr:helix-turn-helix domain-containing protein [Pseudomonas resinovorans]MDA8483625.1 helix-turn-helix domain-containing protein [Pseudomonas resinovorans]